MMTPLFRVILVLASTGTMAIILNKIRKSKINIEDSVFWILMSLMFVVFALFPVVPDTLAALLGIYSTANFLFLFTIFILLVKMFGMSMKIGSMEERIKSLTQKLALADAAVRMGTAQSRKKEQRAQCGEEAKHLGAVQQTDGAAAERAQQNGTGFVSAEAALDQARKNAAKAAEGRGV